MEAEATLSDCSRQSTSHNLSYRVPAGDRIGLASLPGESAKICPFIAGLTTQCTPQLCGPDAPCLNLPTLPEIEDCAPASGDVQQTSDSRDLAEGSQSATASTPDTISLPSSVSQFKKSIRVPQQRSQRARSDNSEAISVAKKAHSLVERRYRENLNGNIIQLHQELLKTRRISSIIRQNQDEDIEEPKQVASKIRKSDVMLEAIEYVHQTEVELRHMTNEIEFLNKRMRQLEKLIKCEDCVLMKQLMNFNI
jgi:hypothetical protein